ncbi:WD40 repeat-like protein [Mycena pura]|uniref:WD40 repeat-like protein n=1 Tax=Mycena pura TaxID=153505 RepID=A0AAD6YA73_9AGAR|nr:WD40 repeat-like protein [Mycena pura]
MSFLWRSKPKSPREKAPPQLAQPARPLPVPVQPSSNPREPTNNDVAEITILRADNLPNGKLGGTKSNYFVSVSYGGVEPLQRTAAAPDDKGSVVWNHSFVGRITSDPPTPITLSVIRQRRKTEPLGSCQLPYEKVAACRGSASVPFALALSVAGSANSALLHLSARLISLEESASDRLQKTSEARSSLMQSTDAFSTMYSTWQPLLSKVKLILDLGDKFSQINPYAMMVWSIVSLVPKVAISLYVLRSSAHLLTVYPQEIDQQIQRDQRIERLILDLYEAFEVVVGDGSDLRARCSDAKLAPLITRMLQQAGECVRFIRMYASEPNFWVRLTRDFFVSDVDDVIAKYCSVLAEIKNAFLNRSTVSTKICVLQIAAYLDDVSRTLVDLRVKDLLDDLGYGDGVGFDPEPRCLEGTRTVLLNAIESWIDGDGLARGLILFGQAGTGKSTIAHEIARRYHARHQLTSTFFFNRSSEARSPHHPIITLVRDLSDRIASFESLLLDTLRADTALRHNRNCGILLDRLLLKNFDKLEILGRTVIVFDALDECSERATLVATLAKYIHLLPTNFRLLITARPENDLETALGNHNAIRILRMDDPELSRSTTADIARFVRYKLPASFTDEECTKVADSAGTLFQWAAVACHFVNNPLPGRTARRCFNMLFTSHANDAQKRLDDLYKTVLESIFPSLAEDADIADSFRFVMGQILSAASPLSRASLIGLGCFVSYATSRTPLDNLTVADNVESVIIWMGALLSNVDRMDAPILPLHTSFRDFLNDQSRGGIFHVDETKSHSQLAECCLGSIIFGLKFNICDLQTSHTRNCDIPDLPDRLKAHVSPHLTYACRFWHLHLSLLPINVENSGLFELAGILFRNMSLFWLEVLSLIGDVSLAISGLLSLQSWLTRQEIFSEDLQALLNMVDEFLKFTRYFAKPIAESAPHIYISALAFIPETSMLRRVYSTHYPGTLSITRGLITRWPALQVEISASYSVFAIAVSPDSKTIVGGLQNGTIGVWSSATAALIAGPLQYSSARSMTSSLNPSIQCLGFSPNGRHIVSGARDGTVCIWNIQTGECLVGPLDNHMSGVESVTFSPSGSYIASCSMDGTIRVCNSITGEVHPGKFSGHTSSIYSIAFSSDGKHITSGSADKTICIWDASSGNLIAGPFQEDSSVLCVAYSPDGVHIASGLQNRSISIRHVTTGMLEVGPLRAHSCPVWSVAFSPDGQRLVSGSSDCTVRMWNPKTGAQLATIRGHTDFVKSVAFLSSGHQIVSCSMDHTIRIWDADTAHLDTGSEERLEGVYGVAVSPDAERLASGSTDGTVHVWDATTGELLLGPLSGHLDRVLSVAFSPDGLLVASASADKNICIWDAFSGELRAGPLEGHTHWVRSVAFSGPDDPRVCSGSYDKTVRIWRASTGELVAGPLVGHRDEINAVAFSLDGSRVASGSDDTTVRVWDGDTGDLVAGPFTGHTDWIRAVAFSPDGRRIASGSNDTTIRVWNAETGNLIVEPFRGHTDVVISVAFSSDGERIASGSFDHAVRIWDSSTGQTLDGPFLGHTNIVTCVAFFPDSQRLASSSSDRTILVWDTPKMISRLEILGEVDLKAEDGMGLRPSPLNARTALIDGSFITKDGWVTTSDNKPLCWIPRIHRNGLDWPRIVLRIGGRETVLNGTNFAHGERWTDCSKRL